MNTNQNPLARFFGVAIQGQTYLNALYLLLAFPLGLFYFIFLVTGLSLGVSLIIVWVGIFLLLLVFAVWYALLILERQMAIVLLHQDIPPITRESSTGKTAWQQIKSALANPVTWKGLVYLIAKFPLGIISFVVLVTFLSISFALLAAPVYFQWAHPQVTLDFGRTIWVIDTLPEALGAFFGGVLMLLVSMHIFNWLAWISGKFAWLMLGDFSQPAVPNTVAAAQETAPASVASSVKVPVLSAETSDVVPPLAPETSAEIEHTPNEEAPTLPEKPAGE